MDVISYTTEEEVYGEELEDIEIDEVVQDSLDSFTSSVVSQSIMKSSSSTLKRFCRTRCAHRYYSTEALQKNFQSSVWRIGRRRVISQMIILFAVLLS